MNKIYTFTLKGEDYPSERFNSNLRLFAHMLYESVYTYYDEYNNPLDVDKNIVYNRIHDNVYDSGYYLDSDIIDEYSLIIVEASKETDFSYIKEIGYKIIKEKIYKTNKHIFVQKV